MTKAAATLEEVIRRLEELKSGIQETSSILPAGAKIDGEKISDHPVTRAEIQTRDEVGKLCDRIEKLQARSFMNLPPFDPEKARVLKN